MAKAKDLFYKNVNCDNCMTKFAIMYVELWKKYCITNGYTKARTYAQEKTCKSLFKRVPSSHKEYQILYGRIVEVNGFSFDDIDFQSYRELYNDNLHPKFIKAVENKLKS